MVHKMLSFGLIKLSKYFWVVSSVKNGWIMNFE